MKLSWRFRRKVGRIYTLVLTTCGQEVLLPLSIPLMVEITNPYSVPSHALCCFRHISLNPVTVIPPCSGNTESAKLAQVTWLPPQPVIHTHQQRASGAEELHPQSFGESVPHTSFSASCFWNSDRQSLRPDFTVKREPLIDTGESGLPVCSSPETRCFQSYTVEESVAVGLSYMAFITLRSFCASLLESFLP